MRFEQTRDVLDHAREYHHQISLFYQRVQAKSDKARVKLLLDYMSRREQNLADALQEFERDCSKHVLDTWMQYTHDQQTLKMCPESEISPDMSVEKVIELGMRLNQCLIDLYKEATECADTDELRAVFKNLLVQEQHEREKLARNAQLSMDF